MSLMCLGIPTGLILLFGAFNMVPKSRIPKNLFDIVMITIGTYVGIPVSISVYPPTLQKSGTSIEKEFH